MDSRSASNLYNLKTEKRHNKTCYLQAYRDTSKESQGRDYRTKRMPGNPKDIGNTGKRTRVSQLPVIL